MAIITVKSQKELDMIPLDTEDIIRIEFGTCWSPAIVRNRYKYRVVARENSSVEARGNSSVVAWGNSSVEAWGNSSVEAWGNSSVVARENSSVVAWGNSSIVAWGNSSVVAWENSSIVAWGNSSVEARENSSVVAWENSSVVAWGNSSVEARENSSVVAWENSSIVAWGNSSVEAWGNVQVVDFLQGATIQLSENARTVYMPRNIEEFMNFYGIEHDKTTALFYKAVHKRTIGTLYVDGKEFHSKYEYISDYDAGFKYEIGKKVTSNGFDDDAEEHYGKGIHISHKSWALDFGKNWGDLALLEVKVKIKDILLPKYSDGKVRAPKVEVIREVPLEECGLFGQILLKRRNSYEQN